MEDARTALIADIKEYESDTFTASGSEITQKEAEDVADGLIEQWKDHLLDGVKIDAWLAEIR